MLVCLAISRLVPLGCSATAAMAQSNDDDSSNNRTHSKKPSRKRRATTVSGARNKRAKKASQNDSFDSSSDSLDQVPRLVVHQIVALFLTHTGQQSFEALDIYQKLHCALTALELVLMQAQIPQFHDVVEQVVDAMIDAASQNSMFMIFFVCVSNHPIFLDIPSTHHHYTVMLSCNNDAFKF